MNLTAVGIGVVLVFVVLLVFAYRQEGDAGQAGETVGSWLATALIGLMAVAFAIVAELGQVFTAFGGLIGEFAGWAAAIAISALAYAGLEGLVDLAPGMFALIVIVVLIAAAMTRAGA